MPTFENNEPAHNLLKELAGIHTKPVDGKII
jgi:hypothetical protein